MRTVLRRNAVVFLFACLLAASAFAQSDAAIKVTTVLHEDGTKTVTQLNRETHASEAATYDNRDKVIQRIVYKLNEQNKPLESTVYGPKGNVLMTAAYKLDKDGRVAEESDFSTDGGLMRRLVFHYDASGRVTKMDAFDANGNEINQSSAKRDTPKKPPRRH